MSQPAIILITCDELRRDAISAYGNSVVPTPYIDSIAQNGTRFDRCYTVSPWCLPARCSILTGKYPHHTGAYSNFRKCPLDVGIDNMFTLLHNASYHTSLFGKCHFAPVPYSQTRPGKTLPYDQFRDYYVRLGIDHLRLQDDKQVSIWFYDDYSKELDAAGYLKSYRDCNWDAKNQLVYPFPGPSKWHPDAWVGQQATDYIKNWNRPDPFFSWISFSGPHYPFDAPEEYLQRASDIELPQRLGKEGEWCDPGRIHYCNYHGPGNIDGAGKAPEKGCKNYSEAYWDRMRRSYYANIALIDDQVGEIQKAAKARFGDDCLIFFTADHGEMLGDHGIWGKHNCGYDQVWRIPLLAHFPGMDSPTVSDAIVNLNDLLPTMLEVAGLPSAICDGISLLEQKKGNGYSYTVAEGEGYAAITDGRYKYIHIQKDGKFFREFLDLQNDPDEFCNIIAEPSCQSEVARMSMRLLEHFFPALLP
ncbi:sulfatase-like hydrolase/transferase [Ruminococcaceae bacterium OttesenSCG-928-L11]|nr:sulfatase-like hydrolase/transferase [Ruminococcaceae bacterium OttesenSCG-928-L11]